MILRAVWLLMLLTVFTLSAAPAREFKVGDLLWKPYSKGSVTLSADKVFTVIDNHDKSGAGITCKMPVEPGKIYTLSGEFQALDGDVENLFVQVRHTLPRRSLKQQKFVLKNNEDFRRLEYRFSAPSNCKEVTLYIYIQPGRSSFKVRNLTVEEFSGKKSRKSARAAVPAVNSVGISGWKPYSKVRVTYQNNEFIVVDSDEKNGAGIVLRPPAVPGCRYSFSGEFKALDGDVENLFIQMRFNPGKKITQQTFQLRRNDDFLKIDQVFPQVPANCKEVIFYVYVQPGKSAFKLRNMKLEPLQDKVFDPAQLKKRQSAMSLSNSTLIVLPADGSADDAVKLLEQSCGLKFRSVRDFPADGNYSNCIIIGNRNNNRLISGLYDRYHLIADSYYPGQGGWQVRTLFNPGNCGKNYLLLAGSDRAGTAQAVRRMAEKLKTLPRQNGKVNVPFFWDVKLSNQYKLPRNVVAAHSFDESEGYGTGMFGWNVLSRYMALFYSTGDEKYARRFLELSFRQDADAVAELTRNKGAFKLLNDPLAGPYHYNSVMVNLYWEMIEDHPVFSESERAKVAAALYRQFLFWRDTTNGCGIYNVASPAAKIGNRHNQWAAVSLYTVARYLDKVMPDNQYKHSMKAAENFFASIKNYYYLEGEGGNLTWFPSGNEPVPLFMLIAGWKKFAASSGLPSLYQAIETLSGNRHGKRIRYYVPLGLLRRTAYLMDDNAPLEFEKNLAEHFMIDTFRLGQSFAPPPEGYKNNRLGTPVGKWNYIRPSKQEQIHWNTPFKDTQNAFSIASWRADNDWGDLIIIDGHLDRIMRQPLHAMTIFTLSVGKLPLIAGYRNQLWARHDGLSFSSMPGSAHWDSAMNLPDTGGFTSSLDISHTLNWQRSLLKVNDFCLIADTLTEKSSQNKKYSIDAVWEHAPGIKQELRSGNQMRLLCSSLRDNSLYYIESLSSNYSVTPSDGETVRLSGGVPAVLFKAKNAGEKFQVDFSIGKDFSGKGTLRIYAYTDRGFFNVYLDGRLIKKSLSGYSAIAKAMDLDLGELNLKQGRHSLTLEAAAPGEKGTMSLAFSALALQDGNPKLREGSLTFSDPAKVRLEAHKETVKDLLSGIVSVYTYQADLKSRQPRTFFTLIAARPAEEFSAVRLADNAALLKLPEKAVASRGKFAPMDMEGNLMLLSEKLLSGSKVVKASGIFKASGAVDVKWDFISGKVEVYAYSKTTVELAGKLFEAKKGLNTWQYALPEAQQTALRGKLASLTAAVQSENDADQKLTGKNKPFIARSVSGAYPADMVIVNDMLAVASGRTVKLYSFDLKEKMVLAADAKVGKIAYASESGLILVGCEDGKVIAFDPYTGSRKWVHVSKEADGLAETGAHWYLKSAFPGIYGINTGKFVNDQENIFVGSASTLEVLDENGKLIRREKILWGPVQHLETFEIDGKKQLIMSQLYPGADYLTRFDTSFNKKIGYNNPPPGCLAPPSWMGINRTGIDALDLNGDGEVEILSGLNGIWNRIVIWDKLGKPLYEVSFGPGDSLKAPEYGRERMAKRFLYDVMTVKNGRRNCVVAATGEALILFDAQLRKIWSVPLPAEPTFTVADNGIIVCGLRNGQLCFFNLKGRLEYVFNHKNAWAFLLIKGNELFAADSQGEICKFKLK